MTKQSNSPAHPSATKRSQIALSLMVVVATLLTPVAALAQDAIPGATIPEPATATEGAVDAASEEALYLPHAPAGYSGGALDAGDETEGEVSAAVDYEAIAANAAALDAETLEVIPTVDSSWVSAPLVAGPLTQEETMTQYLPLMQFDYNPLRVPQLGFGAGANNITSYQDIRKLNAGWYVNWTATVNPPRPGLEFVQMVRVHQTIDDTKVYNAATGQMCGNSVTADRTICPYVSPPQYEYFPSQATLEAAAKANLGSIWLIGNEMERYDWNGGRQDEITPELYAVAYHDIRAIIKAADPTARIAIGGIIQFTPLREQWLNRVWARYQQLYGVAIDNHIDVFNVHNFIGSELCETRVINNRNERVCTGMGIPVGVQGTIVGNRQQGAYLGQDNRHLDIEHGTFGEQIAGFRAWMKSRNANNVNKPLIVTEYGALYVELCPPTDTACINYYKTVMPWGYVDYTNPTLVRTFMTDSFNYFSEARDCSLSSQTAFDCKLVQRWAWFGLEDVGWQFNPYGALIDLNTGKLTPTGELFSNWAASQ